MEILKLMVIDLVRSMEIPMGSRTRTDFDSERPRDLRMVKHSARQKGLRKR